MKTAVIVLITASLFLFTSISMDFNKSDRVKLEKMESDIINATKVLDSLLLEGLRLEAKIDSMSIALQDKEIELTLKNR